MQLYHHGYACQVVTVCIHSKCICNCGTVHDIHVKYMPLQIRKFLSSAHVMSNNLQGQLPAKCIQSIRPASHLVHNVCYTNGK